MGRSFLLGTDAELYTGSDVFATKIAATPGLFGLSESLAASYATLNATWRAAFEAAQDPQTRTQSKVRAKNDAKIALKIAASELARIIGGTPTVTNEQKLELGLSVRGTPAPKPPPGTPHAPKVALLGDGSIEVKWECNNPPHSTGTIYEVWRCVGDAGEFTFVGNTGKRKYIDSTVPAGSSTVTYKLRAMRSTVSGPWATFNVQFGMGRSGGGAMMASAVTGPVEPKMAA